MENREPIYRLKQIKEHGTSPMKNIKRILKDTALNFVFDFLMSPAKKFIYGRRLFGAQELRFLHKALLSQNLFGMDGQMVNAFEKEFAQAYGVPYAVASTSGTAAIHTALGALDLNPGDEIITTPITDMGTIIPILYQQCIPIFADINETYNMDPLDVENKITSRTKAILAVHLFGNACNMTALSAIARKHNIPLIEDCSQAHMTPYKDKFVGTIGDIGCFSFQQSKHMTTGDGGMTITSNQAYYERMKLFVDKGYARKGWGARAYLFLAPNYRMNELTAAVGRAQLKKVASVVQKRRELGNYLTQLISDVIGIRPAPVTAQGQSSYWLYPLYLEAGDGAAFTQELIKNKVWASYGYTGKAIYLCSEALTNKKTFGESHFPFSIGVTNKSYEYKEGLCSKAEETLKHLICISLDESWEKSNVEHAAKVIRSYFNKTEAKQAPIEKAIVAPQSPSLEKKIKIGIIGCGQMGQWHLEAYKKNEKVQLAAFVDTDLDRAKKFAHKFGARAYSSHTEMLKNEKIDGVSVCTVPVSHKNIILDLLNSNVHVLCEKPLAISIEEAKEMAQKAQKMQKHLLTAFKFRFFEEVQKAKDLLDKGGIGRVMNFRLMFGGYMNMTNAWYANPQISGGGVIMDNGPHAFDLIRYLLGEIGSTFAEMSYYQDIIVEDTAQIRCSLKSGGRGVIDLSWSSAVPSKSYLEIYGENGTILLDFTGIRYKFKTWDEFKFIPNETTIKDGFDRQINHFIDAIDGIIPSVTTLEDGVKAQELIEKAYTSTLIGALNNENTHAKNWYSPRPENVTTKSH
jgi:perosamine synthetase